MIHIQLEGRAFTLDQVEELASATLKMISIVDGLSDNKPPAPPPPPPKRGRGPAKKKTGVVDQGLPKRGRGRPRKHPLPAEPIAPPAEEDPFDVPAE